MLYVLFRDHPNTHREVYLRRDGFAWVMCSKPSETNLRFISASEAYQFGKENGLLYWKVGRR